MDGVNEHTSQTENETENQDQTQVGPSSITPLKTSVDPNIPSTFKRVLFWHGPKNEKKCKNIKREKIPAVISSPATIQYFKEKEQEKEDKEKENQRK